MKVISTNIGARRTVTWKFKKFTTGIFKEPSTEGIQLGYEDVQKDVVHDRKYHGGVDKACYIYSLNHYPYWQKKYPKLEWQNGMLGENLTVRGFDEKHVSIGDIFKIGTAVVQVSEARQPCSTLNMRFGSSKMIKDFIAFGHCGAYVRVLQEGRIMPDDKMILEAGAQERLTLHELFHLLYNKNADEELIQKALLHPDLGEACRANVKKFHRL